MPLPLIGLAGYKGSGKDTVAGILARGHGYRRRAFGDAVKREIYEAFGHLVLWDERREASFASWMAFVDEHKDDPADSRYGWLRTILQCWGTEYRRCRCGPDYWVDALRPELGPGVTVSDVRFANEAAAIRAAGGRIWRVDRPGHEGDAHASEQGPRLFAVDTIIRNDGTLSALAACVEGALAPLLEGEPA